MGEQEIPYLVFLKISEKFVISIFFFVLDLTLDYCSYLPPEFFLNGVVDEKSDVYAYGVLALELITGRPALDKSQKSLVMWV